MELYDSLVGHFHHHLVIISAVLRHLHRMDIYIACISSLLHTLLSEAQTQITLKTWSDRPNPIKSTVAHRLNGTTPADVWLPKQSPKPWVTVFSWLLSLWRDLTSQNSSQNALTCLLPIPCVQLPVVSLGDILYIMVSGPPASGLEVSGSLCPVSGAV